MAMTIAMMTTTLMMRRNDEEGLTDDEYDGNEAEDDVDVVGGA